MAFLWCRDKIIESREPFNYQKSAKNEIRGSLQHAYMSKYTKYNANMKIFIIYLYTQKIEGILVILADQPGPNGQLFCLHSLKILSPM